MGRIKSTQYVAGAACQRYLGVVNAQLGFVKYWQYLYLLRIPSLSICPPRIYPKI